MLGVRDENDALDHRFPDAGLDLKHPRLRPWALLLYKSAT
jgi:hypothetical protein